MNVPTIQELYAGPISARLQEVPVEADRTQFGDTGFHLQYPTMTLDFSASLARVRQAEYDVADVVRSSAFDVAAYGAHLDRLEQQIAELEAIIETGNVAELCAQYMDEAFGPLDADLWGQQ